MYIKGRQGPSGGSQAALQGRAAATHRPGSQATIIKYKYIYIYIYVYIHLYMYTHI